MSGAGTPRHPGYFTIYASYPTVACRLTAPLLSKARHIRDKPGVIMVIW